MTLKDVILFVISLAVCALSVHLFVRNLTRFLPRNILVVPSMVFIWTYFIVVPAMNIGFDTYVDERVFISDPVNAMTVLNVANAVLLCIATLGTWIPRLPSAAALRPTLVIPSGILVALTGLVLASVAYGIYTIYLSASVLTDINGQLQFSGSIYQYLIIESGPLAFCWLMTLYLLSRGRRPELFEAAAIGAVQLVLILALSSSRGSRVAIISQLLICAQIYNFFIFRFRLRHYLVGGIALAAFLQVYAYYKYGGINALNDYISGRNSSETVERYNNPVTFVVGDIGRADIQAPLITRYMAGAFSPNFFGETYLSGMSLLLPKELRANSLRPKVQIGADAQLDPGGSAQDYQGVVLEEGSFVSSRIYGLFGEALLNFGWIGPPIAFLLFGILARAALLRAINFQTWDRLLTTPFFAAIPIYMLFYDFDNLIVQTVTVWTVPALVLAFFRLAANRQ